MNGIQAFTKELTGRAMLIVLVSFSIPVKWWIPIIVAPLFWQIWDTLIGRRSRIDNLTLKLIADMITWVIWLSYIAYSIISFGQNLEHWYGWLIGVLVGLVIAQFLGLLWPHRWHLEAGQHDL